MTIASIEPEPGVHYDWPWNFYAELPYVHHSALKMGRISAKHMLHALTMESKATDNMGLGTLAHLGYLQPTELLAEHVAFYVGRRDKRIKDYQAFCEENEGKIILPKSAERHLVGVVKSLREHPMLQELQSGIRDREVSGIMEWKGSRIKARADMVGPSLGMDLKLCAFTAHANLFARQADHLGYALQGVTYRRVFGFERWLLVAVESAPPYDVVIYEPSPESMDAAEATWESLMDLYAKCCLEGRWPGRSDKIVEIHIGDVR